MSAEPATDPVQAPAPKKKNNKKKKKAAKEDAAEAKNGEDEPQEDAVEDTNEEGNGHANGHDPAPDATVAKLEATPDATAAKLEAMGQEREALRAEVEQLRKQLETIQEGHVQEVTQLRSDLDESNTAKEQAEEQYEELLGRVEKIRKTLGDRLNRDRAELEEARERIEELEGQVEELQGSAQSSGQHVGKMKDELADATRELNTLRSRNNLSTQNWGKEKDELSRQMLRLKQELESTSNAMGEWEVIAMEERSVKESLTEKSQELEEQVSALRRGYEGAAADRDSQATLVDNLQNALREIQDARKRELREMVESTEAQLDAQKKLVHDAVARADESGAGREELARELERTAPFEKEVREKNLLIGKLRHEAIVLNEHLTKALRYLKKTKPEDNVDRQIVTNHLLHFLTLDRGDVKRFQVLQVMAGYLNWTDEQREQAGLARPGTSGHSLRLPASPFHRTPSSPSLGADYLAEPAGKDRESLADLWAGFLERSAQEGVDGPSRKGSTSSAATAPPGRSEAK